MKFPKKVKVLSETYTIKLSSDLLLTENAEGITYPDRYLILIDKSLLKTPRAFHRALWHEIAHAYMFESGVHEFTSGQAIEMVAQSLSGFIIQLRSQKLL